MGVSENIVIIMITTNMNLKLGSLIIFFKSSIVICNIL